MATQTHKTADWNSYETLSDSAPQSIIWAGNGGDGAGKSHFGLTAPGPIFVSAFDPWGMNRVSKDVKVGKQIKIARYPFSPSQAGKTKDEIAKTAEGVWNKFVDDYRVALKNVRTVLWDREDLMWELMRFANFGAQNDAPKEYGPLYLEYTSLVQEASAAGVNLGVLRGLKEKWVSKFDAAKGKMVGSNTGELIPDGMRKVPDLVDITLDHRWDEKQKSFVTKLGKFPNKDYRGDEFPDLTFPMMAMAAYPDSAPEDWE
jgi:hypothetical protein